MRIAYRTSVGKPQGKGSHGRAKDNTKIGSYELGCKGGEWIEVTQDVIRWSASGSFNAWNFLTC
jgi:hypothetical protein